VQLITLWKYMERNHTMPLMSFLLEVLSSISPAAQLVGVLCLFLLTTFILFIVAFSPQGSRRLTRFLVQICQIKQQEKFVSSKRSHQQNSRVQGRRRDK
jgi:hypothetical protein